MKHVVVTGANGFVGQHVCRTLVESGREVTACIRETADASVFGDLLNQLRVCRTPILGLGANLSRVFRDADAVIHLAARVHVMRETADDPLDEFRKVNVAGTENLASLAVQSGVRRFIYVSSIKVNGEETKGHAFTADDVVSTSDAYGRSKWEAEERLRHIAQGTTMDWVIVRPPLIYGPQVRGNFIALFKAVYYSIPLPLGSLRNSRSLVSVYNLGDFLSLLLDHPSAANNRFLVSDSEDISTPELVRRMAAALHRAPQVVPCPASILMMAGAMLRRKDAVRRLCSSLVLDKTKTGEILGWSAPLSLDCGLERTAEWFLNRKRRDI